MDCKTARTVTIASAGVVAVAAFSRGRASSGSPNYGIDGDGQVTLAIAVIGGVLALVRKLGWIAQFVLSAIVVVFSLVDLSDAGSLAAIGLYLTFLGSAAWLIGSLMMRAARSPVTPADPPVEQVDPA
jgi:hypothetical protein